MSLFYLDKVNIFYKNSIKNKKTRQNDNGNSQETPQNIIGLIMLFLFCPDHILYGGSVSRKN